MGKTIIHLVRHAQGTHNLPGSDLTILDPPLTPLGHSQCSVLAQTFPYHDKITHLVSSPLRRTLFTLVGSFSQPLSRGLKVIASPLLQETSKLGADTGLAPALLAAEFANTKYADAIDLSLVHEGWDSKQGIYGPSAASVQERSRQALKFIHELSTSHGDEGDRQIVVVTHGGFLHFLTEDWVGNEEVKKKVDLGYVFAGGDPTGWKNCEYRSYRFADIVDGDGDVHLVELDESRARRKL